MSAAWGLHKPDPAFFARVAAELGLPPAAIAYVGDRVDNDVRPAAAAGMVAVFVRRGPWGWIHRAVTTRPRPTSSWSPSPSCRNAPGPPEAGPT